MRKTWLRAASFRRSANAACSRAAKATAWPTIWHAANDETLLIALIEDIEAWRNLDEILEVDGIGVFFVAPSDFAASMGHIGDAGHPEVQEKIEDALKRIVAAGRTAGTLAMDNNVRHFAEIGVRFFFTVTAPWVAAGANAFKASAFDALS